MKSPRWLFVFDLNLVSALLFLCLLPQALRHTLVPSDHVLVRIKRKAFSRKDLWEHLTGIRIFNIPRLHSFSNKLGMLFWA